MKLNPIFLETYHPGNYEDKRRHFKQVVKVSQMSEMKRYKKNEKTMKRMKDKGLLFK